MQQRVASNVIWNWAGSLTHLLVGFVVMRFLVDRLGPTLYGLWILIAALTGYFSMLDLGISGALSRNIAFLRSRGDSDGVNRLVSTAVAMLLGAAALTVAATGLVLVIFFHIFSVPEEVTRDVQIAIVLVGLNLALSFPCGVFFSMLWAYERFDLLNRVEIPSILARAVLTIWWVSHGGGLIALAIITLGTSLASGLGKMVCCFRIEPRLRVSAKLVDAEAGRAMFGYGIWFFLLSLSRTVGPQISPTLVGNRLDAAKVTAFRIPLQLTAYANTFLCAGTQVLTPHATALHANEKADEQRRLFLDGGRYSLYLGLGFVSLFFWLGEPLIRLWMGAEFVHTWNLLMILALGELLPMSQWISHGVMLGMGKHRSMAILSVVENVVMTALAWFLIGSYGLVGVSVAVAVPAFVFRGLWQWWLGCRLVGISLWQSLWHSFVPTVALAVVPALILAGWLAWLPVTTWPRLLLAAAVYAATYAVGGVWGLLGLERTKKLFGMAPATEPLFSAGQNAS
ncbi:MAG: oligosaccharide flippase family protein [Gemmataceae bacterium]|nr:oligosaccharide flippase family protein [Gemmataceae bacterium]